MSQFMQEPFGTRLRRKTSAVYSYPNAWRSPYSLARESTYAKRVARLYLVGLALSLMANVVFGVGIEALWFTDTESAVFLTCTTIAGVFCLVRSLLAFRKSTRLGDVHTVWMEMFEAPHSWRELALARKAYAYAQQDDALRFAVAATVTALGAPGLLVVAGFGFVLPSPLPASAWVWVAASLCAVCGGMALLSVRRCQSRRMELEPVLGHREVRPPDMRLFPHRHAENDGA